MSQEYVIRAPVGKIHGGWGGLGINSVPMFLCLLQNSEGTSFYKWMSADEKAWRFPSREEAHRSWKRAMIKYPPQGAEDWIVEAPKPPSIWDRIREARAERT